MSSRTYSTRLNQLIEQIKDHPHKEEILKLAQEQMAEDDFEQPRHL